MEFRLLGPLEVLSEGQTLPIGGAKQRGVLALLLLAPNEVVSTDRLIDEVWGHRPPKSVEASLQNCISNLRAVIGRELIETPLAIEGAQGGREVAEGRGVHRVRILSATG